MDADNSETAVSKPKSVPLSHSGLILADRVELVHTNSSPLKKQKQSTVEE